jgi:hypothetical protein
MAKFLAHLHKCAAAACGFALIVAGLSAPAFGIEEVPEIDAGSLSSAVALLVGGAYLIGDRFRRR